MHLYTLNLRIFACLAVLAVLWLVKPVVQAEKPQTKRLVEDFLITTPTLPNSLLNFQDLSQQSCCVEKEAHRAILKHQHSSQTGTNTALPEKQPDIPWSAFEQDNPHHSVNSTPPHLVTCSKFSELPDLMSNAIMPVSNFRNEKDRQTLPIESYSTSVSLREGAQYLTDPKMDVTSDFHIETAGGSSQIKLSGVNRYSVCMARGNNVAMIANTNQASILTYNGSDHIYLSGHNTNMLVRTGDGEDLIELYQAQPVDKQVSVITQTTQWSAYNIYKSAISGGTSVDTLLIKGTPIGSKWCNIGRYNLYGESFYVVEFALPPTVSDGPRRQRVSIGQSIEFVIIQGKKYALQSFLAHGFPVDETARSVALNAPLAPVPTRVKPVLPETFNTL